jgi:hypothetical protein
MGYNGNPNMIEPCKPYQYQGQYDEFGKKCGFGRWTYNGNNIYEGMWKDDVQSGYGRFIYQNGGYYQGEYKNGHRHGNGVYVDKDGIKHTTGFSSGN